MTPLLDPCKHQCYKSLYHGTVMVLFVQSNLWCCLINERVLHHCTYRIRLLKYLQAVVMDVYDSHLKSVYHRLLTLILFDCFWGESNSTPACFSKSAVHPSKGTDESVVKQSGYSQRQSFGQENGKRQKVTPPILWKIQTNRVTDSLD